MSVTTKERLKRYRSGLWAEFVAEVFLMVTVYRILERRYKTPVGEIDILACRKNTLIAVEVKARRNRRDALYAVTGASQGRIERAVS